MKKLSILFTCLFLIILSSNAFSEWKELGENNDSKSFLDFESIKKIDKDIYWWELIDYISPQKNGSLSKTIYKKGDCNLFRMTTVTIMYYTKSMGKGKRKIRTFENSNWHYPSPKSYEEFILNFACKVVKLKYPN